MRVLVGLAFGPLADAALRVVRSVAQIQLYFFNWPVKRPLQVRGGTRIVETSAN